MYSNEKWINEQLNTYKGCREDVIRFIDRLVYWQGKKEAKTIIELFSNGYCYYFALMLKDAFGGEICWLKGYGHILWKDENDTLYDINGVYTDYNDDEIVPISELGDKIEDFKHKK